MVQPAEADVVGPAVAADDPDAPADKVAGEGEQVPGVRRVLAVNAAEELAESVDPDPLRLDLGLRSTGCASRISATSPRPTTGASRASRLRAWSDWASSARRIPSPNSALSSNSELFHAGPRPCAVDGPRRRRQVRPVDRRAAGRVGHDHPVAEQLADQPDVGRLTAAAAGSRELEQRLELPAAPLIVSWAMAVTRSSWRDASGSSPTDRARASRCSSIGSMLMALWPASVLLFAGQTSTHTPQPVQSSGATWIVSRWPGSSAALELLVEEGRRAPRPPPRRERPSSGSSRAGRPWRTCRSRCRSTDPRSGSAGRSPASRSASCRSGRCRRRAAR